QRYSGELSKEFKEADAIIGVQKLHSSKTDSKISLTPAHYSYLKICESCYNKCSFCAIPSIKGKFASRSLESILQEVERLDARGVKELNLIGQDITSYGIDLYKKKSLAFLLKKIIPVTNSIKWIRLLYNYPSNVTDELLEVIAKEDKICKYIDIPIQHISDKILKAMNRRETKKEIVGLIDKIRKEIPEAVIRTTMIVGFPGETENDFKELMQFVDETGFDRLGAFMFSREEGTKAFDMKGQIGERIKKERYAKLMKLQQKISHQRLEKHLGKKITVIIDEKEKNEEDIYIGRSQYDAPEVDGVVYVRSSKGLNKGDFVVADIKETHEYDLAGEAL
ncbi:MAG: 30S ribosomal protein S12 methylthiotransferase RimO, partial [Candidatus Omnitrophica bacterium]|nr:30S ribosomal protein S12 methylthiotransferase RimO [Candidatus Omnitrophota bacterium]